MELSIELDVPPDILRPNAVNGVTAAGIARLRAMRFTAKKQAKRRAAAAAMKAMQNAGLQRGQLMPAQLVITHYYFGQKLDLDNVAGSCKAYLDGMAEAVGFNDREIDVLQVLRVRDKDKKGKLELKLLDSASVIASAYGQQRNLW